MIENGDLFAAPLPGVGFVTAHVVLALEQIEHAGLILPTSLLRR